MNEEFEPSVKRVTVRTIAGACGHRRFFDAPGGPTNRNYVRPQARIRLPNKSKSNRCTESLVVYPTGMYGATGREGPKLLSTVLPREQNLAMYGLKIGKSSKKLRKKCTL